MISIIIPVFNEEKTIRNTIDYLYAHTPFKRLLKEVIVVDGGSTDKTVAEAEKTGATVMFSPRKGRAAQLNYGAEQASGRILYFLQPNALPPEGFISEIAKAFSKGYACGTFPMKFDYRHWLLNVLCWYANKASSPVCLSDQGFFVTKELFEKTGGMREDHLVMANQEMIKRLRRYTNFALMKGNIICAATRYLRSGILRTEIIQTLVYLMHRMGYPQNKLTRLYRRFLRWNIGPKPEPAVAQQPLPAVEKELTIAS